MGRIRFFTILNPRLEPRTEVHTKRLKETRMHKKYDKGVVQVGNSVEFHT